MADYRFQDPPEEYSARFMANLLRDLAQILTVITTPGPLTVGKLTFMPPPRGCPTVAAGLPIGGVYADGEFLKIVLADVGYAPSFLMTAAVGTVVATG